jgi:hypothetical protein
LQDRIAPPGSVRTVRGPVPPGMTMTEQLEEVV